MTPQIDRLVKLLEKGVITPSEFFNSMLEALGNFSAGEKLAFGEALAGQNSERVREEVVKLLAFVRNEGLSRDFEHVRRNSPLQPGIRLDLFGGDNYSPDRRLSWLGNRKCRRATFVRFERQGTNLTPVAFVEFDEAIDVPGHQGCYGVLFARYGCDHPAWALPEGSVALCVVEALQTELHGFCDSHPFTERHARYRVQET